MCKLNKLTFVLAAIIPIVLTACGKNGANGQEIATASIAGGYIETEITPPELSDWGGRGLLPQTIFSHNNGAIDLFIRASGNNAEDKILNHYRSVNAGEEWEEIDTSWLTPLHKKYGDENSSIIMNLAMKSDQEMVGLLCTNEDRLKLVKNMKGSIEEIEISDWNSDTFYNTLASFQAKSFAALNDDSIAISFGSYAPKGYLYDGSSGKHTGIFDTDINPLVFQDNRMVRLGFINSEQAYGLIYLDYNGQVISAKPLDLDVKQDYMLCNGENGDIYILSKQGVCRVSSDKPNLENLLDASRYAIGSPDIEFLDFQYDSSKKCFYVLIKNTVLGTAELFRYQYDEKLVSPSQTTVRIFSLKDSDSLRQAISCYQIKYPDRKIDLEIGLERNNAATKADVVRVLNTELLAGKGADILVLDTLPIESYISKGILADLSEIAESGNYFSNVFASYQIGESIYAIPARYTIPLLVGDKDSLDAIDGLPDIADKAKESAALPQGFSPIDGSYPLETRPLGYVNRSPDLIRLFYNTYGSVLVNEDREIDVSLLSELLKNTKDIFKKYCPDQSVNKIMDAPPDGQVLSFLPEGFYGKRALLGIRDTLDFKDFCNWAWANSADNDKGRAATNIYVKPLCGPADNTFVPAIVVAVNDMGSKKEEAKDFIRTMLSEEVQRGEYSEGFPINKSAFRANLKNSEERFSISYGVDLEHLAESLKTPVTIDGTILEATINEAKKYYADQESLEVTVENICQNIRIYLAEKS